MRRLYMDNLETLQEILKNKQPMQLKSIILEMCGKSDAALQVLLNWEEKRPKTDDEVMKHWSSAQRTLKEYIRSGGKSNRSQEKVISRLHAIEGFKSGMEWESKSTLLSEMAQVFAEGHPEIGPSILQTAKNLCAEFDEKAHLAHLLESLGKGSDAADIFHEIGDYANCVRLRKEFLETPADYIQLANGHREMNDPGSAKSCLKAGFLAFSGAKRLPLLDSLFGLYESEDDETAILSLEAECNDDASLKLYLEKLFLYLEKKGDYESAKEHMIRLFAISSGADAGKAFRTLRSHLSEEDWALISEDVISYLKKKDIKAYLDYCQEKKMNEELHDIIFSQEPLAASVDRDELAYSLRRLYPREAVLYFLEVANSHLSRGDATSRKQAAQSLAKVRSIYIGILRDEKAWLEIFESIQHNNLKLWPHIADLR
jgi:hypothetical protein